MSRIAALLFVVFSTSVVYGMECQLGHSSNIIERIIKSCPRPILDSSDKEYCCIDIQTESFYCCNAEEALKTGLGILLPIIIGATIIVLLIGCCISCLCCSWCPWYRRRHRGTVYGHVQVPSVVHTIQAQPGYATTYVSQPVNQNSYPAQSVYAPDVSQPVPPPPYTNEAYAKQAPHNPHYAQ
ncbi:protein shisa-5 [Orussus abietinus]|uniref:protein shisa-5 n=1 Tax=Orussus abietinus TaxID=222816 RepID=UPI0006268693|nr:protein shisa-5 [Orussus abietinus]